MSLTQGVNEQIPALIKDELYKLTIRLQQTLRFVQGVFERNRTVAMGVFTDVAFNANDFTASAGTWTLAIGDLSTFQWRIIGTSLLINFCFDTTSVTAGGAFQTLRVQIPGSFVANRLTFAKLGHATDNGVVSDLLMYVTAGGSVINFARSDGAAFTNAANTTTIRGQIEFEVRT